LNLQELLISGHLPHGCGPESSIEHIRKFVAFI